MDDAPWPFRIRPATREDVPALRALIEASVRGLGPRCYTARQIEQSLDRLFGVDTQLIDDGTYFAVEPVGDSSGERTPPIVGAGGWSKRKTPFGGDDATPHQDAALRDPATDPAVIRAFFVHPDWTRRGIGRRLLRRCETEAQAAGFTHFELTATLTGLPLYAALGYRERESITIPLGPAPDGETLTLEAVRMTKSPSGT